MGASESTAQAEWLTCGKEGPKPKLTYFAGLKSRGEPTQILAAYEGLDIEVELIDFEEWGRRKDPKKLPYMPYITYQRWYGPEIILETVIVMKHMATLGGKSVVDKAAEELCTIANSPPIQLADPQYNLPDGGLSLGVPPYNEWLPLAIDVIKDYVVKLGDGPFFAGERPGFGEAFIWHNLDNCFAMAKPEIAEALGEEDMAKLQGFYDRYAALDGVKEYLAKRPTVWGVPGSKANPTPPEPEASE